jgi:hypothetical protein
MKDQYIRETAKTIPKYDAIITIFKEKRNVFLIFLDSHLILYCSYRRKKKMLC